jgi:hypothetical protein
MNKIVLGVLLGVGGTLFIQHNYKKNARFRYTVERAKKELGLDSAQESLNVFDKLSLIWQRFHR